MRRRDVVLAAVGGLLPLAAPPVEAQGTAPRPSPAGEVKPLGEGRYQIGRIVVDRATNSFVVPAQVIVVGKPLEYLATSPGGMKAYETLLELETNGTEFNLACILIGLERDPRAVPMQKYRQVPKLVGPRVELQIAWSEGGNRREIPAAVALLNKDAGVKPEEVEWVYVGAPASEYQRRFTPDDTGTLIGFVHDANTIIETAAPIGLGAYGSVRGSGLPPQGTAVELIVRAGGAGR